MKLLKVALVVNAANDLGYETIFNVLSEPEILEICTPVVFGLQDKTNEAIEKAHPEQQVPVSVINNAEEIADGRINLIDNCHDEAETLRLAVAAYMNNRIDIIVDIPTEICDSKEGNKLRDLITKAIEAEQTDVFDWTINGNCKCIELSKHEAEVQGEDAEPASPLIQDITAISKALRRDHTLTKPRIAVVSTDKTVHEQLVTLRDNGVFAFGPFDAGFLAEDGKYRQYDAILFLEEEAACGKWQDELGMENTFGYISGLPMVVTYLPAGHKPEVQALKTAIYTSIDIFRNRIRYRIAASHPLEKQWVPRGRDDFKLDLSKEEAEA